MKLITLRFSNLREFGWHIQMGPWVTDCCKLLLDLTKRFQNSRPIMTNKLANSKSPVKNSLTICEHNNGYVTSNINHNTVVFLLLFLLFVLGFHIPFSILTMSCAYSPSCLEANSNGAAVRMKSCRSHLWSLGKKIWKLYYKRAYCKKLS